MSEITFEALPLAAPVQQALRENEYITPSPIQAQAIPILIEGRDLMGCAQTGTGKTAAFALPIIHQIETNPRRLDAKEVRTVVLTPTRELAVQIGKNFDKYSKHVRLRTALVYGGVSAGPQIRALAQGVDVLIATPGRLLDLLNQRKMDLRNVEFLVLDEADRMLDMGFIHDVRKIVLQMPEDRQSLFFSATMSREIKALASTILKDPATVTIAPETTTAENIEHRVCFLDPANKKQLLADLVRDQIEESGESRTLVFSRTKHGANRLATDLTKQGLPADAIHGNKSQSARQKALDRFSQGRIPVLVATDVAARGIDVKGITLVINYDLPNEPEAYVHRIGRTARAGAKGLALSFCTRNELQELRDIEKLIRREIEPYRDHNYHDRGMEENRNARITGGSGGKKGGGGGSRNRGGNRGQSRSGGGGRREGNFRKRGEGERRGGGSGRREGGFKKREGGFAKREGTPNASEGTYTKREAGSERAEGGFKRRGGGFAKREGSPNAGEGAYTKRDGSPAPRERSYGKPARPTGKKPGGVGGGRRSFSKGPRKAKPGGRPDRRQS